MKIILADIPDDKGMASSIMVASAEIRYMDALEIDDDVVMDTHPKCQIISHDANKVAIAQESILIDLQEFSDKECVCSVSSINSMDDAMIDQLFSE
eukprot:3263312-Ditylum_brightwellii.AAC.1